MINSNESTSWNISVLFKPSLFTWYGDTNKSTPINVIIQLCHVNIENNKLTEVGKCGMIKTINSI